MDGRSHAQMAIGVEVGLVALGGLAILAGDVHQGSGLIVGGLCGFLVTPDADHHVLTYEEKRWKRVPILGPYMLEVFAGYGSKNRHRGRSHWVVWGTLSRVVYFGRRFAADSLLLAYVVGVVLLGGSFDGSEVSEFVERLPGGDFFAWLLVGWVLQDTVHILTDLVWSWWKKKR